MSRAQDPFNCYADPNTGSALGKHGSGSESDKHFLRLTEIVLKSKMFLFYRLFLC